MALIHQCVKSSLLLHIPVDEIKDYIHADKLHYLSREGLCRAVSDIAPDDLCFACFNGDYSVEVPAEQEEGVKYVLE